MKKLVILFICMSVVFAEDVKLSTVSISTVGINTTKIVYPTVEVPTVNVTEVSTPNVVSSGVSAVLWGFIKTNTDILEDRFNISSTVDTVYIKWNNRNTQLSGITATNIVQKTAIAKLCSTKEQLTYMADFSQKLKMFKDRRNLTVDSSVTGNSGAFLAWLNIYQNNESILINKVKLRKNINMVAEASIPVNYTVLKNNLNMYKEQGFDSVLVSFDCSENIDELLALVNTIKNEGFNVWFAYGKTLKLEDSVFVAPATLKLFIERIAPLCEGMFVGWRRTSAHLLLQDKPFTDYIIKCARTANSNLQILGESYYGTNSKSNNSIQIYNNVPDNVSGILIVNVGYYGVNVESIMRKEFYFKGADRVVLIVGSEPDYTKKNLKRSFTENLSIKKKISERFKRSGACGIVILHSDGEKDNLAYYGCNN